MELVSEVVDRERFEVFPFIRVPVHALDVQMGETEEEVFVSYLLAERGDIVLPMGSC